MEQYGRARLALVECKSRICCFFMQVIVVMVWEKNAQVLEMGKVLLGGGLLVLAAAFCSTSAMTAAPGESEVASSESARLIAESLWARATLPGRQMTAIYGQLASKSLPNRVVGMRSNLSKTIELHETMVVDGKMRMSQIDWPSLEPGKPFLLEPGGMHLMVFGLEHPLIEGDELLLDIEVESGEIYSIPVQVQSPRSLQFESKQKKQ